MYTVTTTFTRPDTETPYYIDYDPVLKAEFRQFIESVPEYIADLNSVDITDLEQVVTAIYEDEAMYAAFMTLFNTEFPTFMGDRDAYCELHNISITRSV